MEKQKRKKKRRVFSTIFFSLVFLIGLAVLIYPIYSRWHYNIRASTAIDSFESGREGLSQEEIKERMGLAAAYNEALTGTNVDYDDPYEKERLEEGVAEYARMLEVQEQIGHINIPKILIDIPIYAGTAETVLQKGAGHMEGTSLPIGGNNTHSVITAHRGLPEAKLFTDLNKIEEGDRFYITNIKETIAYQVDQIKTIEPSNFDDLLIVPGHDYVTLLTCTPYMINSHRLLVRGHRIDYVDAVKEKDMKESKFTKKYQYLFYGALALLALVTLLWRSKARKLKKMKQKMEKMEPIVKEEKERMNYEE